MSDDYSYLPEHLREVARQADENERARRATEAKPASPTPTKHRLVSRDGVATAGEMQAFIDEATRRHFEKHGAPQVTVEALVYSLRTHGAKALVDERNQQRLAELSEQQLVDIIKRLHRLQATYPAVTDDVIKRVMECAS
jgi:hypothetical protein